MNNQPLVSIIMPTKNSEETIEICLKSIKEQTYSNYEIIVVDNYSIDKTREIAGRYGALVYIKGPERTSQFNLGVRKAKGKYIYYIGSDFIIQPSVIEQAVQRSEKERCDAICIHNTSDPTISFWSKVRKLERDCYKNDLLNVAARFFKKKAYEIVGGYDSELVACEEYDLQNRLIKMKYKIGRIKAFEIHIGEPRNLKEIARKNFYYGKTLPKYIAKNKSMAIKQFSPIRLAFIKNWRKFANHPILTIGFIIYQIIVYFSVGLGYLATRVHS